MLLKGISNMCALRPLHSPPALYANINSQVVGGADITTSQNTNQSYTALCSAFGT